MRAILSVAFLNLKQGIKEKLFWGVVFFLAFFLFLSLLLGNLSPGETENVLRNAGISGIEISGIILVVFSFVFSYYREIDSRILEIYLSKFSRSNYISGKLLGYSLICLFYLILSGLGYILILCFQGAFLWPVLPGIYVLFLKLSLVLCWCAVFCCLFSSPILALLCVFSFYFASEAAYPALKIISLGQGQGGFKLSLFQTIYYLLPNMNKLNIKPAVTYGNLPSLAFFIFISLYSFIYILFLWLIARFIFLRKEY